MTCKVQKIQINNNGQAQDMTPFYGCLVAAKINYAGGRVAASLITPQRECGDGYTRFLWETGPTRTSARFVDSENPGEGEAVFLFSYGAEPEDPDEADDWWDQANLHFLQTFYPATPSDPAPDEDGAFSGWISPDGNYYVAHYGHHDAEAQSIVASIYGRFMGTIDARELLLETWLLVHQNGVIIGRNDAWDMTPAQKAVVDAIVAQDARFETSRSVRASLENYCP